MNILLVIFFVVFISVILFGVYKLLKLLEITWHHCVAAIGALIVMLIVVFVLQIFTNVVLNLQLTAIVGLLGIFSLYISYGIIYRFLIKKFKNNN